MQEVLNHKLGYSCGLDYGGTNKPPSTRAQISNVSTAILRAFTKQSKRLENQVSTLEDIVD